MPQQSKGAIFFLVREAVRGSRTDAVLISASTTDGFVQLGILVVMYHCYC